MRAEFLVFGSPVIGEEEIAEVVASLRSGWVGTGPKVQRFERMLAEYVGAAEVRCLSSCTAALMLALRVAGFIIVSVGVVGLYVGRIFEQVKNRPLYLIDSETASPDHEPVYSPADRT